jgi:hypothetical protein
MNKTKTLKAEAEKQYINIVNELVKSEKPVEESQNSNSGSSFPSQFEDINASIVNNKVYKIVLNRPNKLNAITVKVKIK